MIHVASWNVDGLRPYLGVAATPKTTRVVPSLTEIAALLRAPDVLCLQELRLRDCDEEEVKAAEHALPGFTLVHSLADDRKNASFRGGRTYGVGTYVRSDLGAIAVPRQPWDREGRFVMIILPELRLAIGNVYAVNGTDQSYWDLETGLRNGDRHAWKRRFHEHVADASRQVMGATKEIDLLLIGDWNISQQRIDTTPRLRTEEPHVLSRASFQEKITDGLDVADVFRVLHPDTRQYTWFNRFALKRGRLDAARVDFALLSRARMPAATATIDGKDLLERLGSDHVPIHIELNE